MTQQPNNNSPEENQSSNQTESQQASEPQPTKKPFFKALTIRILRGIIARLENTVEKLEAEPEPAAIEQTSQAQPSGEELRGWDKRLQQVRDRLPNFISEPIPDWMLTTILVGAGVAVVWSVVAVIPEGLLKQAPQQQQEEEEEVTQQPEPPIPPPEETTEPDVKPEPQQPATDQSEEKPKAPSETQAEPELTPEQNLIASIQEELSEITTTYAEGLINALEANFRDSRLIITVDEQWYDLSPRRQDELGKEMLARSRKLDFTKLVLTTSEGTVVARSPVVGEKMVILQRENPSPTTQQTEVN